MTEKFRTLFPVKSSLISLYIALTVPIPYISSEQLRMPSLFCFILGLVLIFNITSDYVETCEEKISYKTSFIARAFGKKNWDIIWEEIKSIKALPTSQGSKVFYFIDKKGKNLLIPQRIDYLFRHTRLDNAQELNYLDLCLDLLILPLLI